MRRLGLCVLLAWALGAVAAATSVASHPGAPVAGTEEELRAMETELYGPEHAAEHATARQAASQEQPPDALSAEESRVVAAAAEEPANEVGRWNRQLGRPVDIPAVAIHSAVLPTGKILYWSNTPENTSQAWLFDPSTSQTKRVDPPLWRDPADGKLKPANIWCGGQSLLADGQVLVAGGSLADPADDGSTGWKGLNKLYTFDPYTETWTEQPDMGHGRWYPSQLLMGDGRTLIMDGYDETGAETQNQEIEMFSPAAQRGGVGSLSLLGTRVQPGAPPEGGLYPHMFWMRSGRAFVAGPQPWDSWFLSEPGAGSGFSWAEAPNLSRRRTYGTAVPLPGGPRGPNRVLELGGSTTNPGSGAGAAPDAEVFDEEQPGWDAATPQNVGRSNANTVLLPDASMVTVGGGTHQGSLYASTAEHRRVEIYDPDRGSWRLGPAQEERRAYHSTALLLPDGRVWSAGDDAIPDGSTKDLSGDTAEIYEPPYLFGDDGSPASRPVIDSAPASVGYGARFGVESSASIDRAVLVAPGATTHANDMHQRHVELEVDERIAGRGVNLRSPPDRNAAPPGYYMLFLLDDRGVPSVARFVRLDPLAPAASVLDGTPPETSIGSSPSGLTRATTATFGFSASETGSSFECNLDSGGWGGCTSPKTYTTLGDGAHTFSVRAKDPSGNVDPSPATASWTVDPTAPNTTIDSGPTGTIASRDASFGFSSSEGSSTYECRLDGGTWAACSSPKAFTNLAEGAHTFYVRAKDAAGNTDASEASRSFTVDVTAPDTTISSRPPAFDSSPDGAVAFSSPDSSASFQCRVDGGGWGSCSSPRSHTGLPDGAHEVQVRAADGAGNVDQTPGSASWEIDTRAPQMTLSGGPTGETSSTTATFGFSADEEASFSCALDGTPLGSCVSPMAYAGLLPGRHAFEVRATDRAGNQDSSGQIRAWTVVEATPAPVTPPGGGASPTAEAPAVPSPPTRDTGKGTAPSKGAPPAGAMLQALEQDVIRNVRGLRKLGLGRLLAGSGFGAQVHSTLRGTYVGRVYLATINGVPASRRAAKLQLAAGRVEVDAGRRTVLRLRLTRAGRAMLRRARAVRLVVRFAFEGELAGRLAARRAVSLRR